MLPPDPFLALSARVFSDDRASNEGLEEGMADSHADERCRRIAEDARQQGGENLSPQQSR